MVRTFSREAGGTQMTDTTVKKVSSVTSPTGDEGQVYLASGKRVSMRLWRDEEPTQDKPPRKHEYEVVGFVISGRAELIIEGQTVRLEPGDSWLVPADSEHSPSMVYTATLALRWMPDGMGPQQWA
jgi:quercetin dioxygenase-like cupin family protein